MNIKQIDKNFDTSFHAPEDLEWFLVRQFPFSTYGIVYSEEEGLYRRLPKKIADETNEGVALLSKNTAGGRIRFATNSPYIAVHVEEPYEALFPHMTIAGKCGVTLFSNNRYLGTVMPSYDQVTNANIALGGCGKIVFDGIKYPYGLNGEIYQVELLMPLYSAVNELYIGLKKDAILNVAESYKYKKPILFYGSSITQGGCASKPGDDYINRLSRMLDADVINLGFSGSAKAEKVIAEYLANQSPSVFVLDYDHNAPNAEHLKNTHFALYETIREKHPITPIIMMTMPAIETYENRAWHQPRREEILKSFERGKSLGDENLYLIDCYGCFGALENGECGTVDGIHPDSLGFFRMAELLYPLLKKLLNGEK